jgi:DNA modification methylase
MPSYAQALIDAGLRLHQELVWVKDAFVLGHSDYHYQHEPIFYGYAPSDGIPGRPGRGDHEGSHWYGDHRQSSTLNFDRPKRSVEHPTMKPEALVEACLVNSTLRGGGVMDVFAGSGTTVIACERLGLHAYAMDVDPRYVAVAIKRWEDFTGQKSERLP